MNAVETEVATPGQSVSLRCLIVDDDRVSRQLMVSAGRLLSLELRETGCANEAMNWLQQERFDLVLLDHQLDGLTGLRYWPILRTGQSSGGLSFPP